MSNLAFLTEDRSYFPPLSQALSEPEGLLAVGGDLHPDRLLHAYARGIFPWYSDGEPLLWWSPNPRCVLYPSQLHTSKSLKKAIRKQDYRITINHAFEEVIQACANIPRDQNGTWITDEMQAAYIYLHKLGHAHSVEYWKDDNLLGGLYGIAIGRTFFGESMFARTSNASKLAFTHFVEWLAEHEFELIDCQVETTHLVSLGATLIERSLFESKIKQACALPQPPSMWQRKALVNPTDN